MNNNYDDIITLPHPISKKHPRMSMHMRAAQFAPFSAVSGHEQSIGESVKEVQAQYERILCDDPED